MVAQAYEATDISIWSNIQVYSVILRMCCRISQENNFEIDFTKECVFLSGFLCDLMKSVYKLLGLVKEDPEKWQTFYKYFELTIISLLRSVFYIYELASSQMSGDANGPSETAVKTEDKQQDGS